VRSASEMEHAFQAERARVERKGGVFTMVVLESIGQESATLPLARMLEERIRIYDHLGRLDARRLAVVLPDTDPQGAWIFADDVLARLGDRGLRVNCEVYAYPLDWRNRTEEGQDDDQGRGGQSGFGSSETAGTSARPGFLEQDAPAARAELRALAPTDSNNDQSGAKQATNESGKSDERLADLKDRNGDRPVGDLEVGLIENLSVRRRLLDIFVSAFVLTLASPVLLMLGCLVKLTSPGPVFFIQHRAGRGGKPFPFIKFRSMYVDAEERRAALEASNEQTGPIFKIKKDPRITPLGRFLRKSSLDELPQFLNVLRGDMTLIGPRPPRLDEVEKYEAWQRRRLDITGGLTCIWQVSGRSEVGFDDWVRMDLEYQRKRSTRFDLGLLWRTVGAVVTGRGAY
jgi:lipopolysaccharide/colanic/teichoic acid biosynthesis glycosyltransferase